MGSSNDDIVERLDILIALSIPAFNESKYSSGADVVRYCDANHTTAEIVKKTGKTKKAVERALENLRATGTIRSVKKGSRTYYVRLV